MVPLNSNTVHCFVSNLTHWGRETHICVSGLTSIGSDNGLSPGRRQAIPWTNAGISLIGSIGINFSEKLIEIYTFLFKKTRLKMSSGKCQQFFLSLNVLIWHMQHGRAHMSWSVKHHSQKVLCFILTWSKYKMSKACKLWNMMNTMFINMPGLKLSFMINCILCGILFSKLLHYFLYACIKKLELSIFIKHSYIYTQERL